ncbi:MAG: hypothetical protein RML32_04435 [Gammaproteobacteria bacterium]|nr:hypothetical protein [Gammaproteobacteria bacterium]
MRGEFIGVWSETWREIWRPLIDHEDVPDDIFCELYRELASALKSPPSIEELADIIDDTVQSREAFQNTTSEDLAGERALVSFFEASYEVLEGLGGDKLSNRYFNLLEVFIAKYSLRYDLRRPCLLCPTLPGVFASLVLELRALSEADPHLGALAREFKEAVRDLRQDCSEGRIKTCIQKQVNLLEALGRAVPGVTENTLGRICDQVGTWPHETLKVAVKALYGFASDYPGIRHAGNPKSALRPVDMRDLVALSIVLTGFIPYLTNGFDPNVVYRRG